MEDEYELIPMNPIRRLERRLERLEKSGTTAETTKELIEIVRANQHVIDDVVRMNTEMMSRMSELLGSVNAMTNRMNDFISRIEISAGKGEGEEEAEEKKEVDERLAKLEKRLNALILSSMARKRLAMVAPQ